MTKEEFDSLVAETRITLEMVGSIGDKLHRDAARDSVLRASARVLEYYTPPLVVDKSQLSPEALAYFGLS